MNMLELTDFIYAFLEDQVDYIDQNDGLREVCIDGYCNLEALAASILRKLAGNDQKRP